MNKPFNVSTKHMPVRNIKGKIMTYAFLVSWKTRGRGWQGMAMARNDEQKEHWRFLRFSRQEILQGGQKSEQKQCRVFRHVSTGRFVEGSRLAQFLKFRLTILHVILVSWYSCPGRGMFIPMKLHFVQITILPKPTCMKGNLAGFSYFSPFGATNRQFCRYNLPRNMQIDRNPFNGGHTISTRFYFVWDVEVWSIAFFQLL